MYTLGLVLSAVLGIAFLAFLLWKSKVFATMNAPRNPQAICGLLVVLLAGLLAVVCGSYQIYCQATSVPVTRELTITSVKLETQHVSSTILVGEVPITTSSSTLSTSFTTAEYPEKRFTTTGHRGWKIGEKVTLVLYMRDDAIYNYKVK